MTAFLRRASIRTKVLLLVMTITTVALLLTAVALFAWDYSQFRTDIQRELFTQARIVLENSTAAMSFQDAEAARETLETLAPNDHILLGCLYTVTGTLFAEFRPDQAAACPAAPPPYGQQLHEDSTDVSISTDVGGRPAGSIYLRSDLEAVTDRVRVQAATAASVLVLSLVVALLLSSSLQRIISEPINALARTARDVSQHDDYSLRATKSTDDELGVLVDAFNSMLGEIERSERERASLLRSEREANRLKDEFLMTLSHELRTPLNAIHGWTRMLLSGAVPADGMTRALQNIERNARAQTRLVEDLLEVSRFTTGKFHLDRHPVDLVAIALHTLDTVRADADARHVQLAPQFDVAAAATIGDADRLQQVFWNLLANAIKFSPAGGVVSIELHAADGGWTLSVTDNGIGIDPKFIPFVFEPFRQADASSTRAFGGLGLGLSIARRIVELHGGRISVDSPGVGKGATFRVYLPQSVPSSATDGSVEPSQAGRPQEEFAGLRILVVDDDQDTREIVAALLESTGADVATAPSVVEGLDLATTRFPDVLISDIAMPAHDGYELLASLRSNPEQHRLRVAIALTAQATPSEKARALSAGFDRHLAKPFDPWELLNVLRDATKNVNASAPLD